jgi:hypothetical protein
MNGEPEAGFQIDPEALRGMISACDDALTKVGQVLSSLQWSGRTAQKWAEDAVSHDVASHYTDQLWSGGYCTYVSISNYYKELAATATALRRTLADYSSVEGGAADSMRRV